MSTRGAGRGLGPRAGSARSMTRERVRVLHGGIDTSLGALRTRPGLARNLAVRRAQRSRDAGSSRPQDTFGSPRCSRRRCVGLGDAHRDGPVLDAVISRDLPCSRRTGLDDSHSSIGGFRCIPPSLVNTRSLRDGLRRRVVARGLKLPRRDISAGSASPFTPDSSRGRRSLELSDCVTS